MSDPEDEICPECRDECGHLDLGYCSDDVCRTCGGWLENCTCGEPEETVTTETGEDMSYTLTTRIWEPGGIVVKRTTFKDLGEASRAASEALHDQTHGHHREVMLLGDGGSGRVIDWSSVGYDE